jgi:hypothetical protein
VENVQKDIASGKSRLPRATTTVNQPNTQLQSINPTRSCMYCQVQAKIIRDFAPQKVDQKATVSPNVNMTKAYHARAEGVTDSLTSLS